MYAVQIDEGDVSLNHLKSDLPGFRYSYFTQENELIAVSMRNQLLKVKLTEEDATSEELLESFIDLPEIEIDSDSDEFEN